jgi:hypothetical protein
MDKNIKIDRTNWHKPSYLGHYDEKATHYEGLRCRCRKCESSFIFSAQIQKVAFENEKKYPGWMPSLCERCESEWESLEKQIVELNQSWELDRDLYKSDLSFLQKWLALLRQAQPYRKKHYESRIRMLQKTIEGLESNHGVSFD